MVTRTSRAVWKGSGKEGSGHISTQSPALRQAPYSYDSRFGDASGTNPEELVAAAHAGCFNMRLASILALENIIPTELETACRISMDNGSIIQSHLMLKARAAGIDSAQFGVFVEQAKETCPMSRLLRADISVEFLLNS